jgi:hypothetical protein
MVRAERKVAYRESERRAGSGERGKSGPLQGQKGGWNQDEKDGCLLRCSAVSLVKVYQRFRGPCCLHHQIALMMEAARTSETLVNFYQTTRRYSPEDSHLRTHRCENLKSYESRGSQIRSRELEGI